MDVGCYFEWCMALKVLLLYVEDIQQLQIELCVWKEELKAMHDKVQSIVETNIINGEDYVCWMVHTNHDIDVKMCYRQFFPLSMHSTLLCKICCQNDMDI